MWGQVSVTVVAGGQRRFAAERRLAAAPNGGATLDVTVSGAANPAAVVKSLSPIGINSRMTAVGLPAVQVVIRSDLAIRRKSRLEVAARNCGGLTYQSSAVPHPPQASVSALVTHDQHVLARPLNIPVLQSRESQFNTQHNAHILV